MKILTGNLVMGGLETGHEAVSWMFDVKKVDGIEVTPPQRDSALRRVKGVKLNEKQLREREQRMNMTPEEFVKYREEWERTKSPRVVGGETILRSGDYLEVYKDDTYNEAIWVGTVCLVECIVDYTNELMPDYVVDRAPLGVGDFAYWHNMHYYGMPAILIPNFGLQQN